MRNFRGNINKNGKKLGEDLQRESAEADRGFIFNKENKVSMENKLGRK